MESNPSSTDILNAIDAYWKVHEDEIMNDLAALIACRSDEDATQALECALSIAERLGFETANDSNIIGIADWRAGNTTAAAPRPQHALICHTDTVAAGPGWDVEPFALTRQGDYLLGRGILDDKGPLVVTLHALAAVRDILAHAGTPATCDWRFLFGTCEETSMHDAEYYLEHYPQPDFLFTPDADFPVSYGEKGIFQAHLVSQPLTRPTIVALQAGTVMNAVPGTASATLSYGIPNTRTYGTVSFEAEGVSAHASRPEDGVNAIAALLDEIFENDLGSAEERTFLKLVRRIVSCTDGSSIGLDCADDDFGPLTCVGSTLSFDGERISLGVDVRYPTTLTADALVEKLQTVCADCNATVDVVINKDPFLIDPHGPYIDALSAAYEETIGLPCVPFTMGGGTYARKFANAASFGSEFPKDVAEHLTSEPAPSNIGGMHAANEGVHIKLLEQVFRVNANAILKLSQL